MEDEGHAKQINIWPARRTMFISLFGILNCLIEKGLLTLKLRMLFMMMNKLMYTV
jgi:hypothetical protein